jgi:hypothetical protein
VSSSLKTLDSGFRRNDGSVLIQHFPQGTGLKRGLLLNFGEKQLIHGIKRISL